MDLLALTVSVGAAVGTDGAVGLGVTTGVGAGRVKVVDGVVVVVVPLMLLLLLVVAVLAVDEGRAIETRDGDC